MKKKKINKKWENVFHKMLTKSEQKAREKEINKNKCYCQNCGQYVAKKQALKLCVDCYYKLKKDLNA